MDRGRVHQINRQRGMVAIDTDRGFTIIELLGDDDLEAGDEMTWVCGNGMGGQKYTNVTKGKAMDVYVQDHWVSREQLPHQLLIE